MLKPKGFTLIELMVALSVFIVIMTISMGAILGVFTANRQASALRVTMDNLNLALESMSREMRFGKDYHCEQNPNTQPPFNTPQDCTAGALVSFMSSDGHQITYRQPAGGTDIEESIDGAAYVPVTAPQIIITNLAFYVFNTAPPPDEKQPKIFISVSGHSGTGANQTKFAIETLVSQRQLDNGL